MLRSDLCDYSHSYNVVVKRKITGESTNDAKKRIEKLSFKNNAPFKSCISKINNTFKDNSGDLDIVLPMYNLLE